MARCDEPCPEAVPVTLSVEINGGPSPCVAPPHDVTVSVGGVDHSYSWDESRDAWVGPGGEEIRFADLLSAAGPGG